MALSWIFSGKKKEEKPVTVEAVEVGSEDDYAIIQAYHRVPGLYPQVPAAPYPYTPLPYSLPQQPAQGSAAPSVVRTNSVQNQLEGVPFVLAPSLNQTNSSDPLVGLEDIRRVVYQITADINDTAFQYNFKLERSTIQEASAYHRDKN